MALVWSDKYKIGVAIIDAQHKRLVDLLIRLEEMRKSGGMSQDALRETITELQRYADRHFVTEEEILEVYGYPKIKAHSDLHRGFEERVAALRALLDGGDLTIMRSIVGMLESWLEKHILGQDKQFGDFLNQKGLH